MTDDGIALRAVGGESLLANLAGPEDLKGFEPGQLDQLADRKSTRLNSSHT